MQHQISSSHPDVSVAAVTDALGRLTNHRAHILGLVSPTAGRVLYGTAITIQYVPFRTDLFDAQVNNFARSFYRAIQDNGAQKVLVLGNGGGPDVSLGGGTKLSRLHNHRLAGLLTDGRLRDFPELETYGPVFYCGGETVKVGTADVMPIAVNTPVAVGGVTIVPGDTIYADRSCAVVIPRALADEALRLAVEIEREDADFVVTIRDETPSMIRGRRGREI